MEALAALAAGETSFLASLQAPEERLIRLVQPRQHVLEHRTVEGGVLGQLRAEVLEFSFLLEARDGDMAAVRAVMRCSSATL